MVEAVNPALSPTPAESVSIGEFRTRAAVAFAVWGGELGEAQRIAVASALASQSPVDACVGLFDAMTADVEGSPAWSAVTGVLLSRAIEAADLIVANLWHGKADAAAAFAAEARAAIIEGFE